MSGPTAGALRLRTGPRYRMLLGAVGVVGVLYATTAGVPEPRVAMLATLLTYSALAMSLDLLVYDANLLSVSHAAFFGVGAYGTTVLTVDREWSLLVAALAVVLTVAVVSTLFGVIMSSRTQGMQFAILSFAAGEIMVLVVHNLEVTGGSEGISVSGELGRDLPFDLSIYRYFTFWVAAALLLTIAVVFLVRHSHLGLRLHALRESQELASSLGFNPTWYKAAAYALSSTLATIIGIAYAPIPGFLTPEIMGVHESILILGFLIVGGMGRLFGPVVGVLLLSTLPLYLEVDPRIRPFVVGAAMTLVMLLSPRAGVVGLVARAVGTARRRWEPPAVAPSPTHDGTAGHDALVRLPVRRRDDAAELLRVSGVTCRIGGVTALTGVDVTVHEGEIVGIIGPNGAGKTTLFNVITGFLRYQEGDVVWRGESLRGVPPHRVANRGLLRTFQNAGGLGEMTVEENLELASRGDDPARVDHVVDLLGLEKVRTWRVDQCSLATRKLVGVALAAVQSPTMLLLDEPLSGLDLDDRDAVVEVIRSLHATGVTILFIEHDIERALSLADKVVILDAGRKQAEETPEALSGTSELHAVYLTGVS